MAEAAEGGEAGMDIQPGAEAKAGAEAGAKAAGEKNKAGPAGWHSGVCPGGGPQVCTRPGVLILSQYCCTNCERVVCNSTCSYFVKVINANGATVNLNGKRRCGTCHVAHVLAAEDIAEHAQQRKMELSAGACCIRS